jgi:hypothetical protein
MAPAVTSPWWCNAYLPPQYVQPAVLVMPDAHGGQRISWPCLNQVRGSQDLTYLAADVPGHQTGVVGWCLLSKRD